MEKINSNLEFQLEVILKDKVKECVSQQIEEEIEKKVSEFKKELEGRKDKYIAEVMKGIRIAHERMAGSRAIHYVVTFENIVRLEK